MSVAGVWNRVLLVHDGAAFAATAWLGDPWAQFLHNFPERSFATLIYYLPAQAFAFWSDTDIRLFILLFHLWFFAVPLIWLGVLMLIGNQLSNPLTYALGTTALCFTLPMLHFPTEVIAFVFAFVVALCIATAPGPMSCRRTLALTATAIVCALCHPGGIATTFGFVVLCLIATYFRWAPMGRVAAIFGAIVVLQGLVLVAAPYVVDIDNPSIRYYVAKNGFEIVNPLHVLKMSLRFPYVLLTCGLVVAALTLPLLQLPRWRQTRISWVAIGAIAGSVLVLATMTLPAWYQARCIVIYGLGLAAFGLVFSAFRTKGQIPLAIGPGVATVVAVIFAIAGLLNALEAGRYLDIVRAYAYETHGIDAAHPSAVGRAGRGIEAIPGTDLRFRERHDFRAVAIRATLTRLAARWQNPTAFVLFAYDWHWALPYASYFSTNGRAILYYPEKEWIPLTCEAVAAAPRRQAATLVAFSIRHHCVNRISTFGTAALEDASALPIHPDRLTVGGDYAKSTRENPELGRCPGYDLAVGVDRHRALRLDLEAVADACLDRCPAPVRAPAEGPKHR